MKKKNFIFICAITLTLLLFAWNSPSKQTKNSPTQEISENPEEPPLFKTLIELTNSQAFKARTATQYDWNSLGKTEASGYEILDYKKGDFIVLAIWEMIGKEDTICFQLLKKTSDYAIYAYNENGKTESPFTYHSGFSVFKRDNNGNWRHLYQGDIGKSGNSGIVGMYAYHPETKTLYKYKPDYSNHRPENHEYDIGLAGINHKYTWDNAQESFISDEAKQPLPNPILLKGGGYEEYPFCNSYYILPIAVEYYRNEEIGDKKNFSLAYIYDLPNGKKVTPSTKIMVDIINSDTNSRIYMKYKIIKIVECYEEEGKREIKCPVIEDYEVVTQSPVVATFTGFDVGDFNWYEFTSRLGYTYYFNDFTDYKYSFINERGDGPNPKLKGKKFRIYYHTKKVENAFGGGYFEMKIVNKIEMLDD